MRLIGLIDAHWRITYTSNVTTVATHTLSGRDSVNQPDETESSLTDTLGTAKVPTPNYSKRPSGKFKVLAPLICVNFVSILPDLY